jgi:hypothetical protein
MIKYKYILLVFNIFFYIYRNKLKYLLLLIKGLITQINFCYSIRVLLLISGLLYKMVYL